MHTKIYIVHTSEVIQKGFEYMLRTFTNAQIETYSTPTELLQIRPVPNPQTVLLVQSRFADSINGFRKLIIEPNDPVVPQFNQISIHTTTQQLQQKLVEIKNATTSSPITEPEMLTTREIDVLRLVAFGHSNKEIAEKLFISIHTVISHRKNITEKLSIKSISGLTVYAILNKLIDPDTIDLSELI